MITKIKSIKKVKNKSLLYDLEIQDHHNFFANNVLVHNCSATYWYRQNKRFGIFNRPEFGICSRTVRKFAFDNSNWSRYAQMTNVKNKLMSTCKDICIQGELCGPSIQGNKYNLSVMELFVFNVFNITEKRYYTLSEMLQFCQLYEFHMVPILKYDFKLLDTVPEMVQLSIGQSVLANIPREGIVVRCINDHKKSFKIINPEFELKYD